MPTIPTDVLDKLCTLDQTLKVIGVITPLRKAGRSFKGRCPFHEEITPSFYVTESKGRGYFHCFGCGVGGDVVTFVMRREGVNCHEAARRLAERFGETTEG